MPLPTRAATFHTGPDRCKEEKSRFRRGENEAEIQRQRCYAAIQSKERPLKVELTPDAAQWVRAEIAAGTFPTPEDAVRHAIQHARAFPEKTESGWIPMRRRIRFKNPTGTEASMGWESLIRKICVHV